MHMLFALAGLAAWVVGFLLLVGGAMRTDIQVGIFATCVIGGFVLIGMTAILSRLDRAERWMERMTPPPAPPADKVEPRF